MMQNRTKNDARGMAMVGGILKSALAAAALWLLAMGGAQATGRCTPQQGFNTCIAYTYTGAVQQFTVPVGVTSVTATMWGAGGGGSFTATSVENGTTRSWSASGGAGGFARGVVPVTPGAVLAVTVGQGGAMGGAGTSNSPTYGRGGGGGIGGTAAGSAGSSGGGMSALWASGAEFSPSYAMLIAGGGGGSAYFTTDAIVAPAAGGGGGLNGGSSTRTGGLGGTQSAGGAMGTPLPSNLGCSSGSAGAALQGGTGCSPSGGTPSLYEGGGGGGGGWFGGGGGQGQCTSRYPEPDTALCSYNGPGGGGSGYSGTGVTSVLLSLGSYGSYSGSAAVPPNQNEPVYQSDAGMGGAGSSTSGKGGDGLVVVQFNMPLLQLKVMWANGSNATDVASIGRTTGVGFYGSDNTSAFTAPASTGGNSDNQVVQAGNVITLPPMTLTSGTLTNYKTELACAANGGAMASTLSGTDGKVSNTLTVAVGDVGKGILCTYTNTPTTTILQLAKTWGPYSAAGNVASIGATTGGTRANTPAFTSTAPTYTESGPPVTVAFGDVIKLPAETMTPPGALANYDTALSCFTNQGPMAGTLSGTNGQVSNTLTIAAGDLNKLVYCLYTNTPKTTLQLVKAWAAGSTAGDQVTIGATTGGTNNTASFNATAPTANNSGTAVMVLAGNVVTLPAETGTNIANYTTTLSCSGGHTLSGTNGQQSNTLTITSTNAAVCTYTNTLRRPQLRIQKISNGGTGTFSFTGSNGYPGQTVTTTVAGAQTESTPVALTAAYTDTTITETAATGWTTAAYTTWLCADRGNSNAVSGTYDAATRTYTIPGAAVRPNSDLVCHFINTRAATLQLTKAWGSLSVPGNVASIGATTGGTENTAAFTSTAPTAGSSAAVTVAAGNTITLPAETLPTGTLANYNTVLSCKTNVGATANPLSGTNGQNTNTLLIGAADTGKDIVCTYTNTPKATTLQLTKAWAAGSIAGNQVTIGATTGGTNNTASFNATAPTATNSGTAVAVTIGNVVALPAETGTNVANYTTTLSCSGGHTLSGTNGQQSNTLTITSTNAAVCTYTNTLRQPTMRIQKISNGGTGTFSFTGTNGYPGQTVTTTVAGAQTESTPVALTAAYTDMTITEAAATGWTTAANTTWLCADRANGLGVWGTFDAATRTYTIPAAAVRPNSDLVCHFINTRVATLQLAKAWAAGSTAGDQVTIGATTGGANNTASFNATAPTATNSGTAVVMAIGNVVTLPAETGTNVANYSTMLSCSGGHTLSGTNGQQSNTLTITSTNAAVCTYTNTPKAATLQLAKSWASSIAGDVASIGASSGGANSTAAFTAAAPSSATSGAAVAVAIGDTITLPAETLTTGTLANYSTVLACTANGGATANAMSGTNGQVSNTLLIGAADAGKAIVCTYTNTSQIKTLSGRVFLDNGVGGGTANDGIVNGGEGPLSGVSVRLTNCAATVFSTALTGASGAYSLSVPTVTATGSALCVEETNPGTRVSTGASVGNVALPSGSAVAAAGGTYTYTRTGASDRIAFGWNGTGHANLNFGDVDNSTFATNGAKTGLPGNTVTYAHTFTAGTAGQVRFSVASETALPPLGGWTTTIFADPGCTGSLQAGAAQLYPPSAAATPVAFAGQVCVIVREFIPATALPGANNKATVQADFTYTNAASSLSGSFMLEDLTTVSSVALELKKEVRNVTQSGIFGLNNQAKSGETLEYRVTYTNNGDKSIRSMVVNDMTPGYTSFVSATTGITPASLTGCVKSTPANAPPAAAVACSAAQSASGTGAIEWRFTGAVEPGGTGTVLFQVKLD